MERYYKITDNGRLVLVGIGEGGEEITKDEYDSILEELRSRADEYESVYEEVQSDGSV